MQLFSDDQTKKTPDLWTRYASNSPRSIAEREWGLAQHEEVLRIMSRTAHQLDDELTTTKQKMADQAREKQARIDELKDKLEATNADHRRAVDALVEELTATKDTLAAMTRTNQDLETRLTASEAMGDELRAEIDQSQCAIADLEVERARLQEEIAALTEELRFERAERAREQAEFARALQDAELLSDSQNRAAQDATMVRMRLEAELAEMATLLTECRRALKEQAARMTLENDIMSEELLVYETETIREERRRKAAEERARSQRAALLARQMTSALGGALGERNSKAMIAALQEQLAELQQQLREQKLTRSLSMLALRTWRREVKLRDEQLQEQEKEHQKEMQKMQKVEADLTLQVKKSNLALNRQMTRADEFEAECNAMRERVANADRVEAELTREIQKLKGKFASLS